MNRPTVVSEGRLAGLGAGRERELGRLGRELEDARTRGVTRWAFVRGPRGIGKSFLLDALARRLAAQGASVVRATATAEAFSIVRDLGPGLLGLAEEAGVPAKALAEVSRRLRALSVTAVPGAPAKVADARLAACEALAELFALAGRAAPAVLVDGAESADAASQEVLRYLAAASTAPAGGAGVGLVVVAFRDDAKLPPALAELVSRTPALSMPLSGLDLDGIRAFLGRPEIAEQLLAATGGRPEELATIVAQPAAAVDFTRRRLAGLGPEEKKLLLALAVLGRPAPVAVVAAMADADGLDRLVHARIVEDGLEGEAPVYGLREAERGAVLSDAGRAEIAAMQAAALSALARAGAPAERLYRHAIAAGEAREAAGLAMRAGEELAHKGAAEEAAVSYGEAARLAGTPADRARARAKEAEALAASGDLRGAMRAHGLAKRDADAVLGRSLAAESARLVLALGRPAVAQKLARAVLGAKPRAQSLDAPGIIAWLASAEAAVARGAYGEAEELANAALPHLPAPERVALRNTLGKALLAKGAHDKARAAFAQNAEEALAAGLPAERARALLNQGVSVHRAGDRTAALALYREALAAGAQREVAALAQQNLGALYAETGDFEKAEQSYAAALAQFARQRRDREAAWVAANLAWLHLTLNEVARAAELGEYLGSLAARVRDPYLLGHADLTMAEVAESRGEPERAVPLFLSAEARFQSVGNPRYAAHAAVALARCEIGRGEHGAALGALRRVEGSDVPGVSLQATLLCTEIQLATGALADAALSLEEARALQSKAPDLEAPWRIYDLAARLKAAKRDPSAPQDAARAARLLDELAAKVPVARRARFLEAPRRAAALSGVPAIDLPRLRSLEASDAGASLPAVIVGRSPGLARVFRLLDPIARSSATVLIRGESGTGKELIAEAIHEKSARAGRPLVKVNCAAMVEELLLSELFGHEKGAFTGAAAQRKGRFELADGGTIFLDEIGDISPKTQVALLRVLQEREFERVGGGKTMRVDVRVVCATNRDLEKMIRDGAFRQDLYYRLKGVVLELPPLRERREDIALLADHFLGAVAEERGEAKKRFAPEAIAVLSRYSWPGNIRELQNVVGSAVIFASGPVIGLEAFEHLPELRGALPALSPRLEPAASPAREVPPEADGPPPGAAPASAGELPDYYGLARARGLSLSDLRDEMERQCILAALGQAEGNISEAARLLGMKRSRLSQIVNGDPVLKSQAKSSTGGPDGHEDC